MRNCSGRGVGQTSGLTVGRASGPEFPHSQDHGAGGSVNRQTGGLTHPGTVTLAQPAEPGSVGRKDVGRACARY